MVEGNYEPRFCLHGYLTIIIKSYKHTRVFEKQIETKKMIYYKQHIYYVMLNIMLLILDTSSQSKMLI